jgi:hypothetical protein
MSDTNIASLQKLNTRLNNEATLYADTLLARIHEGSELEEHYEGELAAAAVSYNRLLCENASLKMRIDVLEGLLRPVNIISYPDET